MTYLGMDNFALRVVGAWDPNGDDHLMDVLALVMRDNTTIVGWSVVAGALYLHWTANLNGGDRIIHPFPAPITHIPTLHAAVVGWLAVNPPAKELSDSDADELDTGFEAWTNAWGHGGGDIEGEDSGPWPSDSSAAVAIRPRTRWIGK